MLFDFFRKYFLPIRAITVVPTNVAVQYSHKSPITPDTNAGAKDRAGFMDAPEIKAKNKISNPTMPPIAIPPKPFSPFVYTTINITLIKKTDARTSTPNIKDKG